jgi:hypothetical protein
LQELDSTSVEKKVVMEKATGFDKLSQDGKDKRKNEKCCQQ